MLNLRDLKPGMTYSVWYGRRPELTPEIRDLLKPYAVREPEPTIDVEFTPVKLLPAPEPKAET